MRDKDKGLREGRGRKGEGLEEEERVGVVENV